MNRDTKELLVDCSKAVGGSLLVISLLYTSVAGLIYKGANLHLTKNSSNGRAEAHRRIAEWEQDSSPMRFMPADVGRYLSARSIARRK